MKFLLILKRIMELRLNSKGENKMQEKIFVGQHAEILDAFLKSEARCYPRNVGGKYIRDGDLNENGKEYVKDLKKIIMDEIRKKCPNGFDRAIFNSYGNAGSLTLSITISGTKKFWDWKEANIFIDLCTCGHLNCWGGVSVGEKKKILEWNGGK